MVKELLLVIFLKTLQFWSKTIYLIFTPVLLLDSLLKVGGQVSVHKSFSQSPLTCACNGVKQEWFLDLELDCIKYGEQ